MAKFNYYNMLMVIDRNINKNNVELFTAALYKMFIEYLETGRIKEITRNMIKHKNLTIGQRNRLAELSRVMQENIACVFKNGNSVKGKMLNNCVDFAEFLKSDGDNFFSAMAYDKVDVNWAKFITEYLFNRQKTIEVPFGDSQLYKDWKFYSDEFERRYEEQMKL